MISVLYIEDDMIDRKVIEREAAGIENLKLDLLEEFVEFDASKYDLIIADSHLGLHTAGDVLGSIEHPAIVIVSGHFDNEKIEDLKRNGAIACYEKPFSLETLLKHCVKDDSGEINAHPDYSYLANLSGGDKDFESELKEIFIQEVPEELALLNEYFSKSENISVAKIAHKLKSKIRIMGLVDIYKIAEKIETGIKDNLDFDLEKSIKQLNEALLRTCEIIKNE